MPHRKDPRDWPAIFYTVCKKDEFDDQSKELRSRVPQEEFSYFEDFEKIPELQDDEMVLKVSLDAFGENRAEIKLKLIAPGEWQSPNCILKAYVTRHSGREKIIQQR